MGSTGKKFALICCLQAKGKMQTSSWVLSISTTPLSTAEILAILEEDEDLLQANIIDAVYIPPSVDELTDEEEIDHVICENGEDLPDCAGTYEIHASLPDTSEETDKPSLPSSSKKAKVCKKTIKYNSKKDLPKWTKKNPIYATEPQNEEKNNLEQIENRIGGKTPFEVFSLYFSDDVWDKIISYTKKYAHDNNRHSFEIDKSTLKRFFGILIFSRYHTLPATKLYWSKDEDKGVTLVRNYTSRNRFDSIKQNIHLSDNNHLDKNDKFSKLRPLFDLINEKNMQFGVFSHNLSIDEEMVPYFGRHSCKMYIKGKPIRFGFKLWCLCSSNGYLFKFIPYGGKTTTHKSDLGLGENVVLELLLVVQQPLLHRVFFDNFFSSYKLFCLLKENGFDATGTIRENRTCNSTMETVKSMKKKNRGTYDFSFDNEQKILLVRWNDNSVVTVATNNCTIEPLVSAKRYNRKQKRKESIPQPKDIAEYNQHMGCVDLHDNGICNYRINVKGKKWWWPLFVYLIDSVIVNSWKRYNLANKSKMSQLEFKSNIAVTLMKMDEPAIENYIQGEERTESGDNVSCASRPNYGRPSKGSLSMDRYCIVLGDKNAVPSQSLNMGEARNYPLNPRGIILVNSLLLNSGVPGSNPD
ncbi:piggyBac transposable element-derived protein 3-like [Belonocnema kinseyi]|uniref:piggyBac transposable element-derived protein 3-like n=1 Tax=Belonocnema kinseyi TaxID=2817044 RepID=UPI00143CDEBF|nr:piggyBac transposable element-derived protein 3-like [Belonocnema kinseyi]